MDAADWGATDRMSAFEGLMWRSESEPHLRSTGVLCEVLDGSPDHERLRAAHEWGTRLLPRLRQRVVEDPLGLAPPRWVVDRDFDLSYHLRFVRLPEPGDLDDALVHAQVLAMAPFDRSRPLWEAVLVEGLVDDRAVYLLKLHHSLADGTGIVQMLDILHGESQEGGRRSALRVPAPQRTTGRSVMVDNLVDAPGSLARGALRIAGAAAGVGVSLARSPVGTVESGARYLRSLGRMLGGPPAPGSPLLDQRSLGRRLGVLEAPLADLRAAGAAGGGSLNDAFIAALAGGLRRYHAAHDVLVEEVPLGMPVSVRRDDDPPGSNRFAGARIALPVAEPDPRRRIELIGEQVRVARAEPAIEFMELIAPLMSRLPAAVSAPLTLDATRTLDVQASNIRGLDAARFLAGRRIERIFAFGAIPGPAVMVTLLSYDGTCCMGMTANAAAVPDADLMLRCLQEGLDEVLELA
jgi:diacylglycerol O-acyltransferase